MTTTTIPHDAEKPNVRGVRRAESVAPRGGTSLLMEDL